ncbi:MAG: recombinase [Actinobacteria bacterium]|nr:recombinase [Actinomycetota bacterium]
MKSPEDFPRNRATKSGRATYCRPCHNRIMRANRQTHYGSDRNFQLVRRYGVDAVQVEWMILQQGGVCALCREANPRHVDHDHRSGKVRGILCFNCNKGLGKVEDGPDVLRRAMDYLLAHGSG